MPPFVLLVDFSSYTALCKRLPIKWYEISIKKICKNIAREVGVHVSPRAYKEEKSFYAAIHPSGHNQRTPSLAFPLIK